MKSVQIALIVLLFVGNSQAAADADASFHSHPVLVNTPDNVTGSFGLIGAFQALRQGNITDLVEVLRTSPNAVNESFIVKTSNGDVKLRLIHVAGLTKRPDLFQVLVAFGARTESVDSAGRNAAHYVSFGVPEVSALFGYSPSENGQAAADILDLLRSEGVNMDVPDSFYRRALHYAAKAGNTEVLARLLSFNVESDPYDNDGNTPIKLAAQHLNFAAIELLKKYRCYTELTTVDYLVGGKNRVASFLYDHTVAVASAAIAATAAICGPFFVTLTNSLLLRGGDLDSADGDDPTLDEVKKNIPQARGLFGQGGPGSGATHVAPLGLAQARKKRVKVEEQAQAPKPAAPQIQQELAAPEVVTTLKRLQAATKALNFARGQHNAVLTDAELNAADALLQELEMLELNSKEREARRHLVAAIRAVVQKFTNPAPLLKIKAMNLFDRYKKYRDKA